MVLSMGAHFFGLMPCLWSVHVFKVVPPGIENVGAVAESLTRGYPHRSIQLAWGTSAPTAPNGTSWMPSSKKPSLARRCRRCCRCCRRAWTTSPEEPEEVILKELIHTWNRYCPALREIQLKVGSVGRRAGPVDAWTQRSTKVTRPGNAGFEDV